MMKVSTPLIQLKVLVNGKPIQEYHKDQKVYVEGRRGSNFSLQLTNLTCRRLLVHPTVDGLSTMTGEEASRTDHSHGYVLNWLQTMEIPGWRLTDDEVARFFFAGEGKSYAEKTGRPLNKGVIAAAVWEEKQYYRCKTSAWFGSPDFTIGGLSGKVCGGGGMHSTFSSTDAALPNDNIFSVAHSEPMSSVELESCPEELKTKGSLKLNTQNLGTGFGKKAEHRVHTVHFTVATEEPTAIATIYYDDIHGLRKRGIRISKKKQRVSHEPNPFPKDSGCVPPHGWRG